MTARFAQTRTRSTAPRYRARGRVWVEGPDGTYLGYGRVVLLERIREHGSIRAAARSMEMSYRHAWRRVYPVINIDPFSGPERGRAQGAARKEGVFPFQEAQRSE